MHALRQARQTVLCFRYWESQAGRALTWGETTSNIGREDKINVPTALNVDNVTQVAMGKDHTAVLDSRPPLSQTRATSLRLVSAAQELSEMAPTQHGGPSPSTSSSIRAASDRSTVARPTPLCAPKKEKFIPGVWTWESKRAITKTQLESIFMANQSPKLLPEIASLWLWQRVARRCSSGDCSSLSEVNQSSIRPSAKPSLTSWSTTTPQSRS